MKVNDIFKKDIHRNIQGVVKIGQDTSEIIREELDEYVVTKELNRHFDKFFESYRKGTTSRTDKIGVWISGFFGSGKSHFLKILSYILSNKEYDGVKATSYFEDKIADSRILADMKVANDTSADVILFNIDAKSDSDSKTNKDAIVKVFMKVFNEMQGFCSSMPWIAELERKMVKDGAYDAFKQKFFDVSGSTWENAREDFYFEEDNIISALSSATKMSEEAARNWYETCEKNYSLDISTFAKKVREYIEQKSVETGKKHYVAFLCDEIGQYIGDNGNLMLNLQTVVENLGSECGGRAWVIATSQEDISKIVSETKTSRDSFSKIIGRFDTRLSLSSSNVDEVIKKRLLAKTETATDKLKLLYADKNAILKNIITFSPDTPEKKLYMNEQDFIDVYPFIPYQFNLLQSVFTGIRTHGASGKHLSEGERSLLNAFQEAAVQFANFEEGTLIPFDAFYRTIETFLDHNIRIVINNAESNSYLFPDDVSVLKVLFMIKYIPNAIPANLENLATLMISNVDADKIDIKKKIDASLRRLEKEKLITKNGDQFIFLTNEEQDINREIKEIHIDKSEIIDRVGEDIFSTIFGLNRKYKYSDRYDFAFNTMIDDRARGNQKEEIGIRVITPIYSFGNDLSEQELKSLSMREQNVIIKLPDDMSFIDEMEQALQIDTFIRKSSGKSASDVIEDIKSTKIRESKQRKDRSKELVFEALKKADIYVNHNKLEIKEKAPSERVNDAFKVLVESIYTKQTYITKPYYTSDDLKKVLTQKDNQMVLDGIESSEPNSLAIEEMIDVITRSSYKNIQTTMKSIIEVFNNAPYGWNEMDIAGIILTLFKNQKIKLVMGGENILVSDLNTVNYVTKRDYLDRLLIKIRKSTSPQLLNNAKTLAKDVFGKSDLPSDEDGIMERIKSFARIELYEGDGNIKDLLSNYQTNKYPGKSILESGKKMFEELLSIKDVMAFFEYLNTEKDNLLDYEEDASDVKKFFKNQKEIFDKAIKFVGIFDSNSSYINQFEVVNTIKQIKEIINKPAPYADIHKLPEQLEAFMRYFVDLLDKECEPINKGIKDDFDFICDKCRKIDEQLFNTSFYTSVKKEYDNLFEKIKTTTSILEAIGAGSASKKLRDTYIERFEDALPKNDESGEPVVHVRRKSINVSGVLTGVNEISSREEIDELTQKIKDKLYKELEENTVISII